VTQLVSSPQPTLVDVELRAALCLFGNDILRLALGADEEDRLALGGHVGNELGRLFEHLQGLLKVDDVNAVALTEDVFLHLGVPALGLVPEVDSSFEQLFHGDGSQKTSLVDCIADRVCDYSRPAALPGGELNCCC